MISYQNKHFRIADKDEFLYGAECHYFRLDPEAWPDRLQKIKDAGFNLVSTYVPWIWHETEEGLIDLDGTTHPRRNLVAFLDLCHSFGLYCIVRPGPYVMSELKNEGIPEWLLSNYPEVIARDERGEMHPTRVVSYLHPTYLKLVKAWYERVCQCIAPRLITNGGSIIMFQLDNEIGMLHWVTNTADNNPSALERYESFKSSLGRQADSAAGEHWQAVEFRRYEYAQYVRVLKDMAESNGIDVPFIVNVHGFKDFSVYSRGVDYPIGLSQLKETAEIDNVILAGDFYPGKIGYDNFHDLILSSTLTDAVSPIGQPLFSAEFQSGRLSDRPKIYPSDVDLITRLCVASGMNALNYYMFCGGDNVEGIGLFGRRHEWQAPIASNGDLRQSYGTAHHLGHLFNAVADILCDAKRTIDTHIGFYTPYYATETVNRDNESIKAIVEHIEHQREQFHFDGIWRLLAAANISFSAIDVQKEIDVHSVPTLWMCTTKYMDEQTQRRLAEYVQQGGKLVIGPELPTFDLAGNPCEILTTAFSAQAIEEKHGFQRVTVADVDSVFCRQYTVYEQNSAAETIAHTEAGVHQITGFLRDVGKGQVLVLGVALTHEYQYHLEVIRKLAARIGVDVRLAASNDSVIVSERAGEHGSLVSIINVDDVAHETQVTRFGETVFGNDSICVGARTGKLLPVQWQVAENVVIEYSTVEMTSVTLTENGVKLGVFIPAGEKAVLSFSRDSDIDIHTVDADEFSEDRRDGRRLEIAPSETDRDVSLCIKTHRHAISFR